MNNDPLPSYRDPPVVEVAASVQFDALAGLDLVHLAKLWDVYSHRYPNIEQKTPLPPNIERLGVRRNLTEVQFQLLEEPVSPRLWFVSAEGNDLLQVQTDRFIRNWRRVKKMDSVYPRYEEYVRPRFVEDYTLFESFIRGLKLEGFNINQCELTYVNDICPNEVWSNHSEVGKVFRCWDTEFCGGSPERVEGVNFHVTKLLVDNAGEFLGRLHIEAKTAFRTEEGAGQDLPIFRLTMTARGRPLRDGIDGVLGFLDLGRKAIVRNFDAITSPRLHDAWGRTK